jgi:predicted transposase YbfD/YdcC
VEHLPIDMLVIAVCAVIAGAESWVDMALYGQNKADWLSTFLRLPNGIPAHDTFRRVFMLIDPEDFESRFTAWTQAFPVSGNREVVAIDGKMVRGSFDDKHGRLVRRRVFACPQAALLEPLRDWPGLRTVVAVESIRSINGSGKVEAEIRYFLSSCTDAPEMLTKAIRQHWSIENSLHWVLEVTFREDDCRVRDRIAVRNFALLRKIAINLVRRHNGSRNSLRARRKIAAWNNQYMRQILTGIFHA